MIGWLKNLFGGMDRTSDAATRAAKAMEDIADSLESVRDQLNARLGIESAPPAKVLVSAETSEDEKKPRGRSKS